MSNDLASLFIKVDSSGVVTASKDLNKLTDDSRKVETATASVSRSFSQLQGVVQALAASYALLKMAQYAQEAAMLAARYETLGVVMRVVGGNAGYTGAQMEVFARGLQKAGISMTESRQSLARMVQAQLDLNQSAKLARVAQDAAVISNMNSSEAFQRLVYGIQSAQVETLRAIGINVNFEESYQKVAKATGRVVSSFTEAEKSQIRMNAAMDAGQKISGVYAAAMDTAGKQLTSLPRLLEDLKVLFGAVFTPALSEIIKGITSALTDLNGQLSGNSKQTVQDWGDNLRLAILTSAGGMQALAASTLSVYSAYMKIKSVIQWIDSAAEKKGGPRRAAADATAEDARTAEGAAADLMDRAGKNLSVTIADFQKERLAAEKTVADQERKLAIFRGMGRRGTVDAVVDPAAEKKAAKEAADVQKLKVDLWIKDEARKWEELAKYENDYAATVEKAAQAYDHSQGQNYLSFVTWRNKMIKETIEGQQAMADAEKARPQKDADEAGKQVAFYKDLAGFEDTYRQRQLEWIETVRLAEIAAGKDKIAANAKAAQAIGIVDQAIFEAKSKQVGDALGQMGSMFQSLSGMYDKSSSEYARMQEAAKAMIVLQNAVAVANAVAAIANQGLGDPYTAFARIAAMVAAMGGLLASTGMSLGGGSISAPSAAYGSNTTVLGGANDQGSESISKSWELLQDTYDMEDTKLSGIYNEMKDLNQNITGLVTSIIRTGVGGNVPFAATDGTAMLDFMNGNLLNGGFSPLGKMLLGGLNKFLDSIFSGGAIDVGSTELVSSSSGMKSGGASVSDILAGSGIDLVGYKKWQTRTTTDLWRDDSYDNNYQEEVLKEETRNLFNKVFKDLSSTFVELSKGFGQDTTDAMGYLFPAIDWDLQGKTADEISKYINEQISLIGDEAVTKLFGALILKYQKVGEGLLESAIRLVIEKEVVISALDKTNKAFSGTAMEAVALSQSLIEIAGDLDSLTEAANTYYDKFFTDAEKQTKLQGDLTEIMKDLGYSALPATREGFRAIVEGLDLTTTSGQEAYVTLLKASGMADEFFTGLEDSLAALLETATDALGVYTSAVQDAASNAHKLADEYRATGVSLRDAIRKIGGETNLSKNKFNETYAKAMTGDTESLSALPALAKTYLADSMATSRTAVEYARDKAMTLNALREAEKVSIVAMNWAEYQAGVLDGMLGILDKIKVELEKGVTANLTLIEGWMAALGTKENMLDWSHFVASPAWGTLITTEPVWSDLIPEPVWTDIMPEPIWGSLVPEPIWSSLIPEPAWSTLVPEPVWDELTTEPVWSDLIPEPSWTNLIPEPLWGSLVPEPVWSSLVPEPIWTSLIPEPVWGGTGGIIPNVTWDTYIKSIDWSPVTGGMGGFVSHLTAITAANSPLITVTTKFGELQTAIGNFMSAIGAWESAIVNWVPPEPVVPVVPVVPITPITPAPPVTTVNPPAGYWNRGANYGDPQALYTWVGSGPPDYSTYPFEMMVANGAAFFGGNIIPFANGGIYNSPTLFPMANGTGLMGEAGPEAIMPLSRGASGKLGVRVDGDGSNVVMIDELRAIRTEMKELKTSNARIASTLQTVTRGGRAMQTEAFA